MTYTLVESIIEVAGRGFQITDRLGISKLIMYEDVFDLAYEMENVKNGKNYKVLNTRFGRFQCLLDGE